MLAIVIGDGSGVCDLTAGEVAGGGPAQVYNVCCRAHARVLRGEAETNETCFIAFGLPNRMREHQNMRRAEGKVLRFALADAAAGGGGGNGGGGGAAGNRSLASLETDLVFTHSGNPWYSTADPWRFPNHVSALGVEGVRACFTHNRQ